MIFTVFLSWWHEYYFISFRYDAEHKSSV